MDGEGGAEEAAGAGTTLDEEEQERYDRGIRLWGLAAQQRMQQSAVAFVGAGAAAAAVESAKNLLLAGVARIVLQDHCRADAGPLPLSANFALSETDQGGDGAAQTRAQAVAPRLQELNPLVQVSVEDEALDSLLARGAEEDGRDCWLAQFSVVVCCGAECTRAQRERVATQARAHGVKLMTLDVFGFEAVTTLDLGEHTYREEHGKKAEKTLAFPALSEVHSTAWDVLEGRWGPVNQSFVKQQLVLAFEERHGHSPQPGSEAHVQLMQELAAEMLKQRGLPPDFLCPEQTRQLCLVAREEFAPVCAIIGGLVGQEIIKAISRNSKPAHNVLCFDATTGAAVEALYPH